MRTMKHISQKQKQDVRENKLERLKARARRALLFLAGASPLLAVLADRVLHAFGICLGAH